MQYVAINRTHYSSVDIDNVLSRMVKLVPELPSKWTFARRGGDQTLDVRYFTPPKDEDAPFAFHSWRDPEEWGPLYVGAGSRRNPGSLTVLRKSAVDELQSDLTLLADAGSDLLPSDMVAQIAAVGAYRLGLRPRAKKGRYARRAELRLYKIAKKTIKAEGLSIRVLPKVVDPVKRRRLTPEQRAAHWSKVYLEGQKAKKLNWRRDNELKTALRSYADAWRDTLEGLERARKAGADPEPFQSLSELLRDLADEWDKSGRIT